MNPTEGLSVPSIVSELKRFSCILSPAFQYHTSIQRAKSELHSVLHLGCLSRYITCSVSLNLPSSLQDRVLVPTLPISGSSEDPDDLRRSEGRGKAPWCQTPCRSQLPAKVDMQHETQRLVVHVGLHSWDSILD